MSRGVTKKGPEGTTFRSFSPRLGVVGNHRSDSTLITHAELSARQQFLSEGWLFFDASHDIANLTRFFSVGGVNIPACYCSGTVDCGFVVEDIEKHIAAVPGNGTEGNQHVGGPVFGLFWMWLWPRVLLSMQVTEFCKLPTPDCSTSHKYDSLTSRMEGIAKAGFPPVPTNWEDAEAHAPEVGEEMPWPSFYSEQALDQGSVDVGETYTNMKSMSSCLLATIDLIVMSCHTDSDKSLQTLANDERWFAKRVAFYRIPAVRAAFEKAFMDIDWKEVRSDGRVPAQ